MDQYELIRTASRVYGKSIRQIRRETGHHRTTIRKALAGTEPRYRRQKEPRAPVMDPVAKIVERWLLGDRQQPRKQRHTARRVYTRLVEEHQFAGAEVSVRRWVREWKAAHGWGRREAVLPLDPEVAREAQVDWGSAWVQLAGLRRQVKFFVMRPRTRASPLCGPIPGSVRRCSSTPICTPSPTTEASSWSWSTTTSRRRSNGFCGAGSAWSSHGSCPFVATTPSRPGTARRGEARKRINLHTAPRCFVSTHRADSGDDPSGAYRAGSSETQVWKRIGSHLCR